MIYELRPQHINYVLNSKISITPYSEHQIVAKNILLIVVDALRYDRVGVTGSSLQTPNLDRFAQENTTFTATLANSNATDVCVTTILTGRYPLEHGVLHHGTNVTKHERQCGHGTVSLAEQFGNESYRTVAVEPVLERWHQDGFDQFVKGTDNIDSGRATLFDLVPDWAISMGGNVLEYLPTSVQSNIREAALDSALDTTDGEEVTRTALKLLDDVDSEPFFFCFLHYWDVHTPYDPPGDYVKAVRERKDYDETPLREVIDKYSLDETIAGEGLLKRKLHGRQPETVGEIQAHYDAAVEYVDDCIGELFDSLSDRGILEDTIVVITADHGESLTEKGVFFDHHGLHDPVLHVPLLIGGPNVPDTTISETVQHVDIAPTICDLAGIEGLPGVGESLVPLIQGQTNEAPRGGIAYAEERHTRSARMIYDDPLKFVTTLEGDGRCRYCERRHEPPNALYHLSDDPDETENLLDDYESDPRAQTLLEHFETFEDELIEPTSDDSFADYDEADLEERLEHLGYK